MQTLIAARAISSIREIWWDIRPHPNFGTVELRICDGIPTMTEIACVAALAQCLVEWMDTLIDRGYTLPCPKAWIVGQNKWRAARHGIDADVIIDDAGGAGAAAAGRPRARRGADARGPAARLRDGARLRPADPGPRARATSASGGGCRPGRRWPTWWTGWPGSCAPTSPGSVAVPMDGERQVLRVSSTCVLPLDELEWRFSASGGPGGQHVNTSNTKAEVRFDVAGSPSLGPRQRARLLERLGPEVRVVASDERSQLRNRELALERLRSRLAEALRVETPRRPTKPTKGAQGEAAGREAPPVGDEAPGAGPNRTNDGQTNEVRRLMRVATFNVKHGEDGDGRVDLRRLAAACAVARGRRAGGAGGRPLRPPGRLPGRDAADRPGHRAPGGVRRGGPAEVAHLRQRPAGPGADHRRRRAEAAPARPRASPGWRSWPG